MSSILEERVKKALELLSSIDGVNEEVGRHEVDDTMYYNVIEFTTKPLSECLKAEAHKDYIDVQYIVKGEERIDSESINVLELVDEYDKEKDIAFYKAVPNMASAVLHSGSCAVYYPENAHMPGIAVDKPCDVKKIVVKIKTN